MSLRPTLPPSLYRQLLIVPLDESPKKQVSFSDLNPVKTFYKHHPPSEVSDKPIVQQAIEHIRFLERKIARLESTIERGTAPVNIYPPESTGTFVTPRTSMTPSTPGTARSVNAPEQWAANDVYTAHPPANVREAIAASSVITPYSVVPAPRTRPRVVRPPRIEEPAAPPASKLKRFLSTASALCFMFGVPLGIVSMVGLGPAGLALAGGAVALSIGLFWLSGKVQ